MIIFFLTLIFLGPRFATFIWWLFDRVRFELAFDTFIWPLLGFIFLPWTTLMYIGIFPGGITGFDWMFMGFAVLADLATYAGGAKKMGGGFSSTASNSSTSSTPKTEISSDTASE